MSTNVTTPIPENGTIKLFPEALFEAGFTDLVSVIPPNAQLTPSSKISGTSLGKVPGIRYRNGLYGGYSWRDHEPTIDDVRGWVLDSNNIGLRAARFPALDIDSLEEGLCKIIEGAALSKLGPAPIRVGRFPKRLLMYRTSEPFGRMQLKITNKTGEHLVELLADGQQYLVYGQHPSGSQYVWDQDLTQVALTTITREQADAFLTHLAELCDLLDLGTCVRLGDGTVRQRAANTTQSALLAPSLDELRNAVELIPNTNDLFPDRSDYLKIGYAVKGACGEDEEDGYAIFAAWAAKWDGSASSPKGNDPEVVRQDWRRMGGPFAVGFNYLAEIARAHGYNDAANDFDADEPAPEKCTSAALWSEQWLTDRVVERRGRELRYSPERRRWYVWDGARWRPDSILLADDLIRQELRIVADKILRQGTTPAQQKENQKRAEAICSAAKVVSVRSLVQCNRAIAIDPRRFDADEWILNTPAGIVDLKTGELLPPNPDRLCTRSTSVAPDFSGACPEWKRFLAEATGGRRELETYLQRLAGYCLTGITREQAIVFLHGDGGNGKGTFVITLLGILADYACTADMAAFMLSRYDRHPTDLAMLDGARLVTASETHITHRWDEGKLKALSGGDPITARFMRGDFFTYTPRFKLLLLGNHRPALHEVGAAMRRRLHLVPLDQKPAIVDQELGEKLKAEGSAILAWAVSGCLQWQKGGLNPPDCVRAATEEYFEEEDTLGLFLRDEIEDAVGERLEIQSLLETLRHRGAAAAFRNTKQLSKELQRRGVALGRHNESGRASMLDKRLRTASAELWVNA